uniref:hypothetical protein n=1 Tax=Evtepia gabavorous TaxID=2211183 RepID=UPI003A8E113E
MISEDRLRQAVRDAGALLDQSLPDPDQCHHTFSPAFLNRMEALLRRRKRAPASRTAWRRRSSEIIKFPPLGTVLPGGP